jgi:endo-1,4-beta-xylanase
MVKFFLTILLVIIQFSIFICLVNEKIIEENEIGPIGNYTYELYKDYGDTKMILKGDGKFSCSWSNIGNAIFRIAKRWNVTQTHQEIGNIKVNYEIDFKSSNITYYSVYGWTQYPLVEYFIIENWEGDLYFSDKFGSLSIDKGTYDMYKYTQVSVDGTGITRIWSVRNEKRNKGTVSVSQHFKAWEDHGIRLGKMYEVSFSVEGYKGSGNANVLKNEVIIE